jgi:hypothetical protein
MARGILRLPPERPASTTYHEEVVEMKRQTILALGGLLVAALALLVACNPARTALPTATLPPTQTPLPRSEPTPVPPMFTPTSVPPTLTPTLPPPEPTHEPRTIRQGGFEITMITNPQDSSRTDVHVKNVETGEEKLYITLSDVYVRHYHNSEYHNVTTKISTSSEELDILLKNGIQKNGRMSFGNTILMGGERSFIQHKGWISVQRQMKDTLLYASVT